MKAKLAIGLFSALMAPFASAEPVNATSYDMPNGNTGSYNYWDLYYTGLGATNSDGAALSGGIGDLTDGVVATDNWNIAENTAIAGAGPYVGWTIDPTISFKFAPGSLIDSVTVHVDDSDGFGGVSLPSTVEINGLSFSIPELDGSAPKSLTFANLGLTTDTVNIKLIRKTGWVFASEVTFDGRSAVPEPATMVALGLGALALVRRRKS